MAEKNAKATFLQSIKFRLLMAAVARHRPKRISAMVRVKNEEEFLYASIKSISDCVDEIVLVDNMSTDRTPSIIETLRKEEPSKVVCHHYPHEIGKVGKQNWDLATGPRARSQPRLSANYYNWCLSRCSKPFVLKWDGDMIALDSFRTALMEWRQSRKPIMIFKGANVHPDFRHLIAAKSSDREALLASLSVPGLPRWATSLTYDYPETRLFPKFLAKYESSMGWTQRLWTPYQDLGPRACKRIADPCYLHLKFCKRDPFAGYSPDLKQVIAENVTVGPPLSPEQLTALERWQLGEVTG
jgi:hypothetical protein